MGRVEQRLQPLEVDLPWVSFNFTYRFADGTEVVSDSTLAFRSQGGIVADLAAAGFAEPQVHDAPDRPGLELVFLARRV